ncbi:MAG: hypothetical protein U1D69_03285, partial [Polynucleobacter sp.]|nr:hypothetical protein [Polynucleobacter sp.]
VEGLGTALTLSCELLPEQVGILQESSRWHRRSTGIDAITRDASTIVHWPTRGIGSDALWVPDRPTIK